MSSVEARRMSALSLGAFSLARAVPSVRRVAHRRVVSIVAAAAADAVLPPAHDGIVEASSVHSSSLASMHLSPPRLPPKPLIYLNATCPFAQKAWIALLEKDVDFDATFEDLRNKSPAMCASYKSATPDPESPAKVPIFIHEGQTMIESGLVAKYVATAFDGGNDILPATPAEEYAGALFAETFNAITPAYFKALRAQSQEEVDAALDSIRAVLKASDRALTLSGDKPGPFAAGDRYTLADVLTSPMLPRVSVVLGHFRGFQLSKEVKALGLTRLEAWMDAVMWRPSMTASLARAAEEHGTDICTALIDHSTKFVSWPKS
mmetsp:Transcript_33809/g.54270  ORF Transcript_33809/g.54270 Transcript_33809/m.54270 type:complete len:320 (+) Transcript_33809:103-1062(+)